MGIRNRGQALISVPTWLIVQQALWWTLAAFLLVLLGTLAVPSVARPATAIALITFALFIYLRIVLTRLEIRETVLVLRDVARRKSIPWTSIERLVIDWAPALPPVQVGRFSALHVVTRDGSSHIAWGSCLLSRDARNALMRELALRAAARRVDLEGVSLTSALERPERSAT